MNKPKILLLIDVAGWAWEFKALAISSRLSHLFDFGIHKCVYNPKVPRTYNLYVAFGVSVMPYVIDIPREQKIVAVTAHLAHRDATMYRRTINEAKILFANSRMLMDEFDGWHEHMVYCPNGVDHEFFTPGPIRNGDITFSHVGKYCPEKHLDSIMIPAANRLKAGLRHIKTDYRNAYPHECMRDHYRECDVHVVSSTIDGTPNPALEAASCGLALISNPIGNMPEFIEYGVNGFLIPLDREAYEEHMKICMESPDLVREMGLRARQEVLRNWTWDERVKNYEKLFRIALGI